MANSSDQSTTALNPNSQKALHLDQQLCFALYSTSLAMTKMYKPLLDTLGLTYPQYLIMLILWQNDGLALKDVGEQLHIDSGALTPVIKRMEAMGLLIRTRNPQNERTLEIRLTKAGWAMREQAVQVNRTVGVSCGLAETEIHALRQELVELRAQLTKKL
ncbi:transcriptional regulator [Rheinheimera sp. A13L]|uniref:MarR family winged helix-turn-helix transcriptional regulator n=1 Tax=Rheinheimera sp. A13L TaxID=506534 RepID=UPI00021256D1|nr:MarR family transcriptional regulator [Rheinheimera sp. A13L]EGM77379.1 transcriptional regulator [Rheinheimera sp. A13L]